MTDKRRLTADEWAAARRRWEGAQADGFDWLAAEIMAAFTGVEVTRQGVSVRAKRDGWVKGGDPSSPLPAARTVAQHGKSVAQQPSDVAQQAKARTGGKKPRAPLPPPPDDGHTHVVDLAPGEKPADYAGTGRPGLYRPEYAQMIIDHFDGAAYETVIEEKGGESVAVNVAKVFPTLERFASKIGTTAGRLWAWCEAVDSDGQARHPEFREAYARARDLQKTRLIEGALAGAFDSRTAQLALKNLAGWRDKVDIDVQAGTVAVSELEATYITVMDAAHDRMREVLEERAHLLANDT